MIGDEGRLPDQTFIEHAAEREQIGRCREITAAARLLRRHILRRPHNHPRPGHGLGREDPASDPEVEDLHLVDGVTNKKEVGRLDVAVDDAEPVRRREGVRDAVDELQAVAHGERSAEQALAKIVTSALANRTIDLEATGKERARP